jgi:hypothetical protein
VLVFVTAQYFYFRQSSCFSRGTSAYRGVTRCYYMLHKIYYSLRSIILVVVLVQFEPNHTEIYGTKGVITIQPAEIN